MAKLICENLHSVSERIQSLLKWLKITYEQGKNLAEAGFYFCSDENTIKCDFCTMGFKSFEFLLENRAANALQEHRKINKDCPYMNDFYVGNITLEEEEQRKALGLGYKDFGNLDIEIQSQALHPEYKHLDNRLFSFSGKWPLSYPHTAVELAETGLFLNFKGEVPCLTCYLCGGKCGLLNDGTKTALQLHEDMSPDCPLLHCTPQIIHHATPDLIFEDNCDLQKASYNGDLEHKDVVGINTDFTDPTCRLATFSSCQECPDSLRDTLVDSGFFYTGRDDCVQCYRCSYILHDFRNSHEEPLHHVKDNPACKL